MKKAVLKEQTMKRQTMMATKAMTLTEKAAVDCWIAELPKPIQRLFVWLAYRQVTEERHFTF
jgi:hypothetical protein